MNAPTTYDTNDKTRRAQQRVCPGCGVQFTPTPLTRTYCRPTCKLRHERQQRPLFVEPLNFDESEL
jgi:hypothetical protein